MIDFIEMIQPYVAGLGLVYWEVFLGWCLWASIRSDSGLAAGQAVSGGDSAAIQRLRPQDERSPRSHTAHVPSTSA